MNILIFIFTVIADIIVIIIIIIMMITTEKYKLCKSMSNLH